MSVSVAGAAPTLLPEMGDGDHFGEIGLIERIPRTATVTAATSSRLLRIDGTVFLDALTGAKPSVAFMDGAAVRFGRTHPTQALNRAALTTEGDAP